MRPSTLFRLILSVAFLFSTVAAAPAPTTKFASAQVFARPGARESTAKILKRLGGQPCPDGSNFTCVTLAVPLDHFDVGNPRTLNVEFAVLPATGKRKGMFVTATGGPGTSGISAADDYTSSFDKGLTQHFDIVFFDQRGVGLSGGLTCPSAAATYYQTDGRADTPQQEAALKGAAHTFADDCVAEMGTPNILPYLGTAQAVEDLDFFRQVMQDNKLWLYGESYGTQYAQTYAAAHGNHLARLILDGTVDLTLNGIEYYTQQTQAFNDTLVATLQTCNDDPACAADMGREAVAAYDGLAGTLKNAPLSFRFPLPSGHTIQRNFTLAQLEITASGQMYSEGDRMLFQRALAAFASRHNLAPLTRLLYLSLSVDPESLAAIPDPSYSDGMFYSVECQDYGYFSGTPDQRAGQYIRAGDPVGAAIPRLTSLFYGDLPCAFWPNATTNLTRPAYLIASGVPTLVLGATADPATPVNNGISVYQHLADGYLITQQGGPHVIFGRGNACPDDIVTAFLVDDKMPDKRKTECEGVVADAYVALAPASARDFDTPLDALASAENEINYLPEYYYWDGATPTQAGCTYQGTLAFEANSNRTDFTLKNCAFSRGFVMTGTGRYNANNDRFVLEVKVGGLHQCDLNYVRDGDKTKVTGVCDGKKIKLGQ